MHVPNKLLFLLFNRYLPQICIEEIPGISDHKQQQKRRSTYVLSQSRISHLMSRKSMHGSILQNYREQITERKEKGSPGKRNNGAEKKQRNQRRPGRNGGI